MKELRDYIDEASSQAGSLTELGRILGLSQPNMSSARAHKRPLPLDACVRVASMLKIPAMRVIAANELVTEKKPEKRNFWGNFREAPMMGLAVGTVSSGGFALVSLQDAVTSNVTKFVTLFPAQAPIHAALQAIEFVLCKVNMTKSYSVGSSPMATRSA